MSITIESVSIIAAACVGANGVIAILGALVSTQCTLINVNTATPINIEGITSIAAAYIGANDVATILDTHIYASQALINV